MTALEVTSSVFSFFHDTNPRVQFRSPISIFGLSSFSGILTGLCFNENETLNLPWFSQRDHLMFSMPKINVFLSENCITKYELGLYKTRVR